MQRRVRAVLGRPEEHYQTCLDEVVAEEMESALSEDPTESEGIGNLEVSVGRASTDYVGDDMIAYQAGVAIALEDGFVLSMFIDNVTFRVGRAVGAVTSQSTLVPLDDLPDHVHTVADNLEAAEL